MKSRDDLQIPEALKKPLREQWLNQVKNMPILDSYELELFDWYVKETETLLDNMRSSAHAFIQKQLESGAEAPDDSGMVAADYYLKRVRYSHVIYMTSLLEAVLEKSSATLTSIVGAQNLPFTIKELKGDQWSVRKKFLERYGKFSIPDSLWSEIQTLIILRNKLVHDNGALNTLTPEEKSMLAKSNGINVSGHEVEIEADFISTALKAIQEIVRLLAKKISEVSDRAIRPKSVR